MITKDVSVIKVGDSFQVKNTSLVLTIKEIEYNQYKEIKGYLLDRYFSGIYSDTLPTTTEDFQQHLPRLERINEK